MRLLLRLKKVIYLDKLKAMYKKCKVVILPTDKAENAILVTTYHKAEHHNKQLFTQMYLKDNGTSSYHLYILSDEGGKKGEWVNDFVNHINPEILINEDGSCSKENGYLKIIASTDSSLTQYKCGNNIPLSDHNCTHKIYSVNFIPQSFIDKYVCEYNKGNKIEEVMVEYDTQWLTGNGWFNHAPIIPEGKDQDKRINDLQLRDILKLNPDNTINIKSIKDSWSRNEVIKLLNNCYEWSDTRRCNIDRIVVGLAEGDSMKIVKEDTIAKWIESNL
jgi:hypothetical protein